MWKSVRVLLFASVAACSKFVLSGAPVDAKVDPTNVPQIEKDIGARVSAVRYAQFLREQRVTDVPQIFYNLVTDGGAACNGDMVSAARSTTITRGTRLLSVSENTFTSG